MPGAWEGVKKAALQGAARIAVSGEQLARRLDLQRRIAQQQGRIEGHYAAIGRLVVGALRAQPDGQALQVPDGVRAHLDAIAAAEAEIAHLQAELTRLGG
jgi:hypothetical protein